MSIKLTPRGQQAQDILDWMWADPDARAPEAHRRLNNLARQCAPGSQELTEVQDAGQVVSRLLPSPA